ncbi:MAG: tetratricopeptide repeat protein [Planctomycetota bacterium]
MAPHAPGPRLLPRPRTTIDVLGTRGVRGSCFGPVYDPCWSWNHWDPHCSPGLTWSLGIGSGSFCWGWSSWYSWHCHRRHHWYSSYGPRWWDPWCHTYATPIWYYPGYVSTHSTVVIQDDADYADSEVIVASSAPRELTPAERAGELLDLGDFYFREGRFRQAADTYAEARSLVPEDATIHFALADAVFALGDYHFAAFLIGEALRLDPELARAETDKRVLYGDPKVFERQMKTLIRYLDDKPYDAMAHLVLGYNLKFSKMPAEAELAFRRVLEIDPASTAAQLFLRALTEPPPADEGEDAAPGDAAVVPVKSDR